ncbi:hypothetical protein TNIN_359231 [Trichonephila inaurata madagascariensis]|uniref:EGF-like domain-containing protein n=1 Tax=Trichonephila inaurata madagascariensis TaxID=2747483 RepID=A0A8X6X4N4_9ARAC|nr:hypothetical protein TNIN_359231 [Trichonephila inaurata madagascariensis]
MKRYNSVNGRCNYKSGYAGKICNETCSPDRWGLNCSRKCSCKNGAVCHPVNGTCICTAGWRGKRCDIQCPKGKYGVNCAKKCDCLNRAKCNHINGTCICSEGFTGTRCEQICPSGSWGKNCLSNCTCQNGAVCLPETGYCDCLSGWKGHSCEIPCDEGTYGYFCSKKCNCWENTICDKVEGCVCSLEYTGLMCNESCSNGTWGKIARIIVHVKMVLNVIRSMETVCAQMVGKVIDVIFLAKLEFLENSAKKKGIAWAMQSVIGELDFATALKVILKQSWMAYWNPSSKYKKIFPRMHFCCDQVCKKGLWGVNCGNKCECLNEGDCSPFNGTCICPLGFTGSRCESICNPGFFGINCSNKCECSSDCSCHHVAGTCSCEPEKTEANCNVTFDDKICSHHNCSCL